MAPKERAAEFSDNVWTIFLARASTIAIGPVLTVLIYLYNQNVQASAKAVSDAIAVISLQAGKIDERVTIIEKRLTIAEGRLDNGKEQRLSNEARMREAQAENTRRLDEIQKMLSSLSSAVARLEAVAPHR